jgi:uncharacterized protein (DUF885 family)
MGINISRLALIASISLAFTGCSSTKNAPNSAVASNIAAQNRLFDEQYESDLKASPLTATQFGDYRYNDQLDDVSLAATERNHAADEGFLARLKAIPTDGFPEQDLLSHQLLARTLEQRIEDYNFKDFEMPVSQMGGPHVDLADIPLSSPFTSVKYYEDYISRLHQIPRVFRQTEEVALEGKKNQLMPVRFLLEKVPGQCDGVIKSNPFLGPTKKFPGSISAADQKRLTQEITEVVNHEVLPAYKDYGHF